MSAPVEQLLEQILDRVASLERLEARHYADCGNLKTVVEILASRTFTTHLTIPEVARARGISASQVRRLIRRGMLTLEIIPLTKISGVPIGEVFPAWIPVQQARSARQKEQRDG